ncbi:MAG: PAS domain S-box protein [Betaproteobacteria bacterium]|nr:PAS domain S-box protein [Betaproteobacteria bacterium]
MPEQNHADSDFRTSLLRDGSTRRFLKWLMALSFAASAVYLLALLFARESPWRGVGALAALLFTGLALLQYRRDRINAATQLLVWGVWLSMALQVFLTNGLQSRSMMAFPLVVIFAGWLLPPRGTWVLLAATLASGAILAWGELLGVLPLRTSPSPPLLIWLAYSIYITLAGLGAFRIFHGFRLRHEAQHALGGDLANQVRQIAAREAELNLIMESVPVMLFRGDRDQRCLYANQRYTEFYGRGRSSLVGLTVRDIVGEEAYAKAGIDATLKRALAGETFNYRGFRQAPSGEERVLDVSMVPEPDGHGGIQGFVALFRDATEEVRAQEAQARSEDKFAKVFRSSPLAVAITRLEDGRYLDVNEAFVRQFGWRREEAIGRSSLELKKWVDPEARNFWARELRRTGRVSNLEVDFRTRSGEVRRVLISAELIKMDGEECSLVMSADITERKHADERARSALARFEAIFQHTPSVAIQGFTEDGTILHWNRASAELYGVSADAAIGRKLPELLLSEDDAAGFYETVQAICHGGKAMAPGEWPVQLRDGRRLWVYSSLFPVVENGATVEVFCMDVDVTARHNAEEALRESSERFAKVFAASPVAISISRLADGSYLEINDAFVEQFGWPREEVIGRTAVEIGIWPSAQDRQAWIEVIQRQGRLKNYETRLNTKSGVPHSVLISVEEIQLGNEPCIVGLVHDITQRLQAEQEIRRLNTDLERRVQERTAELLAANRELESFAYSISHDLRAPLRSIDGFSHLLAEEYATKLDSTGQGYLDRVRRAAQRMGKLIDDILELSRVTRQSMHRNRVDLSRLAREVLDELFQSAAGRKVEIDIAEGLHAQGDPQLLRVLMQNLLENAWKYSSRAKVARISLSCEEPGTEKVYAVADNGVGFDMLYADRLFVPFQRLHKPEDFEGTGIGLATVARIVHRHGGRVWAESAPGKGTTMRFTLPGAPPSATQEGNRR